MNLLIEKNGVNFTPDLVYKYNNEVRNLLIADKVIQLICESANFWNREGKRIYYANRNANMGDCETHMLAKNNTFDSWLLEMILSDCRSICEGSDYFCGRGGSHVFISKGNKRELMIYVQ